MSKLKKVILKYVNKTIAALEQTLLLFTAFLTSP